MHNSRHSKYVVEHRRALGAFSHPETLNVHASEVEKTPTITWTAVKSLLLLRLMKYILFSLLECMVSKLPTAVCRALVSTRYRQERQIVLLSLEFN